MIGTFEDWGKSLRQALAMYAISSRMRKFVNDRWIVRAQLAVAGGEILCNAFIVKDEVVIGLN